MNKIHSPSPQDLQAQFILLQAIRDFFLQQNFLDVLTPPAVTNPGMETHIHPFQLYSPHLQKKYPYYLHTSPEFHMKELLSLGFKKIFTIAYCFRDEPQSSIHNFQFMMLEWYRSQENYEKIMEDIEKLITFSIQYLNQRQIPTCIPLDFTPLRMTIQELFYAHLNFDILNFLTTEELYKKIEDDFPDIPLPQPDKDIFNWDDLYFLLFLNKIEPQLKNYPYLLLYEFPHHLAALSTIKQSDPRVCERFEVYMQGIELCNCFNELCDLTEQKNRFQQQHSEKYKLYGYKLPEATTLYTALERGLPPAAGIALGIERLLYCLTGNEHPFYR